MIVGPAPVCGGRRLLVHVLANEEGETDNSGAQLTSSFPLSISSGPPAHGTVLLTSRIDLSFTGNTLLETCRSVPY